MVVCKYLLESSKLRKLWKFFFFSYLSFLYFCFPKEDQNQNFSIKIVDVFLHYWFLSQIRQIDLDFWIYSSAFTICIQHGNFKVRLIWREIQNSDMANWNHFIDIWNKKKTLYLAKISLMCDFFFLKVHFPNTLLIIICNGTYNEPNLNYKNWNFEKFKKKITGTNFFSRSDESSFSMTK